MATRIKLLFGAVILWQPLQYVVTAKWGEPYPALMMPRFSGTLVDSQGDIRITDVACEIFFRDGQVTWLSAHDLLSQVPSAHQGPIMSHMFSPPPVAADHRSPRDLKARLFPGRALSHIRGTQKDLDSQTRDWLKRRLRDLYPSQEPKAMTFVWYDDVFNVNRVPPTSTREPVGVRQVQFE
jgi:hypothetical protein